MTANAVPTVFVVDDEKIIAETLAAILRREGFAAKPFLDPREALKAALSEPPEVLLSDVVMPQMTGVELAMTLRRLHPECKVLLFSGQAETEDLLLDARRQGYEFLLLLKPVHPSELLRQIRGQMLVPARGGVRTSSVERLARRLVRRLARQGSPLVDDPGANYQRYCSTSERRASLRSGGRKLASTELAASSRS